MKHLSQLIRDIIPVIIGILIALLINNWNEDRKEREYLDQIFTAMNSELEESLSDLKENIPKQEVLVANLAKHLDNDKASIFDIIKASDGIHGSTIRNNSWKAIANTKIELVEFEKLSRLTEIDESKEFLRLKREKLLDFMVANLKSTNRDKKEVFMLLSQEIIGTEKYLLGEIEAFIGE